MVGHREGVAGVSPAHAGVEGGRCHAQASSLGQPRVRGGRGAKAEKIQEQIGSAPRMRE